MDPSSLKTRQLWVALLTTLIVISAGVTMVLAFRPWTVLVMILASGYSVLQWVIYLIYCERVENEKSESRANGVARNV
jgi:hypothetical protein